MTLASSKNEKLEKIIQGTRYVRGSELFNIREENARFGLSVWMSDEPNQPLRVAMTVDELKKRERI